MPPARTLFVAAPALILLAWASFVPSLSAQSEGEAPTREECDRQRENNEELDPRCIELRGRPCRVRWEEQTYGGDTLATTAILPLQRSAPQADGSIVYMGRGPANIVFTPGGGCTATRGRNATVNMMVIVSSDDGRTVEVDIGAFMDDTFEPRCRARLAIPR